MFWDFGVPQGSEKVKLTLHSVSDYRYKKGELFKRLKVTTFAQLVSALLFIFDLIHFYDVNGVL